MVKFKTSLKFDKNVLKELKDDSNSGVELHKAPHHFSLHPIQLNDFGQSIKDILNQGIAKYNKKLDGILLGYQNVKLLSDKGLIVNDSCYIHMDLMAEFFVFKPEIGKEMQDQFCQKLMTIIRKKGKQKVKKINRKKGIDEETPEDETPIVKTKKGNEEDEEVPSPRKNKKKKRKNETSGEDHISGLESPKKHKLKDNVVYDEETPRKKKKIK
ncbi:hypothetical protein NQ318_008030 [Aromia moschata]|uniref:Uncharacterized protein n=1 Tax=Aromia moschata TaxID=1265417 RepID=A0AAV8XVP1_9CUCU|nr:hypothetical protein NQ318_008030 [Aromia moschata]